MSRRTHVNPTEPLVAEPLRLLDSSGSAWRVYDRVRLAPTPTTAEFRFVAPGHPRARARCFVRDDRTQFELRVGEREWLGSVHDLSVPTLLEQLRRAREAGPVHLPPIR
jgi:hypothetical protein